MDFLWTEVTDALVPLMARSSVRREVFMIGLSLVDTEPSFSFSNFANSYPQLPDSLSLPDAEPGPSKFVSPRSQERSYFFRAKIFRE